MANPTPVQAVEESFFRDFVDNSEAKLQEFLLTDVGRVTFNGVKFNLKLSIKDLPSERTEKLLMMAIIQHAISQILSEIAMAEDANWLGR